MLDGDELWWNLQLFDIVRWSRLFLVDEKHVEATDESMPMDPCPFLSTETDISSFDKGNEPRWFAMNLAKVAFS